MSMTHFGATPGAAIESSPVVTCENAAGVIMHVLTSSSAVFTAQVSVDGTNYADAPIYNLKTGATVNAATNVSGSAGDLYYIPAASGMKVKIVSVSGTGTASLHPDISGIGAIAILKGISDSASALDLKIVKYNGNEYQRIPVRGLSLGAAATTQMVAAHATKINVIVDGTIHVANGGSTATLRLTDGTIDLFGAATTGLKPLDITGAAGQFGYHLPMMEGGAANRAISAVTTGASALVADFDYIQV